MLQAELQSRVPEGDPAHTDRQGGTERDREKLRQLSSMLTPALGGMLERLLKETERDREAQQRETAQLQRENAALREREKETERKTEELQRENASLRARCERLTAAAGAAAASLADI